MPNSERRVYDFAFSIFMAFFISFTVKAKGTIKTLWYNMSVLPVHLCSSSITKACFLQGGYLR